MQIVYEQPVTWPQNGPLHFKTEFQGEIAIAPDVARRKANGYLCLDVCFFAGAGEPMLLLGDRPIWRMPIVLRLPEFGELTILGNVEVDASTGRPIPLTEQEIIAIQSRANAIATRFSHPATSAI